MEIKVDRVLVTSGDQALVNHDVALYDTANSRFNIAPGQLGIFDAKTNLGLDATNVWGNGATQTREFYFAVGLADKNGDSFADTIHRSNNINGATITEVTSQAYRAPVSQVTDIRDFTAKCSTEYQIKVRLESPYIMTNFGYQDLLKTYSFVTTICPDDCQDCPTGDCYELAEGLFDQINDDPENLLTASFIEYNTNTSTATAIADKAALATYKASNPTLCPALRITSSQLTEDSVFGGVPINYNKVKNITMGIGLGTGFTGNGTVSEITAPVVEEGDGESVLKKEWDANGYDLSTYRFGFPFDLINQRTNASTSTNYDQYVIEYYDRHSTADVLTSVDSPKKVIVAIPTGGSTAAAELNTVLDAFLATTPGKFVLP